MPDEQQLDKCPKCSCGDLFVRRDFPRLLGLAIIVGAVISFLALASNPRTLAAGVWVLVGSAFLVLVVYLTAGWYTVCYRCRAEDHDHPANRIHHGFNRDIARKYPPPLPSNESKTTNHS
ncbi:MAG: hypothetical protein IT447_09505 [Phycisphaerales bacterium]|jgi:hypothetical protein|nr:hypothetical protein [Phycisphaerales bacterium]